MRKFLLSLLLISIFSINPAFAISDPTLRPNNKFGINILSPEANINDAARLVNTNGDWGYVLIVIKKSEKDIERWQAVFTTLSKKHLIPIVRIATDSGIGGNWEKPTVNDAEDWAIFLNELTWPTKNRYVQIYNEVNRAAEWGGTVNPQDYAQKLDKTIDALKAKNDDFFVLNSPLDLALGSSANSLTANLFFQQMEESIPGIFNKLDGWASHSYPNPDFSAPPEKLGRLGINGYVWELDQIKSYVDKDLPVFITETGWRRGNGINSGLSEETIAQYYINAFQQVWNDKQVVAVTPFVLSYPEPLFEKFSFVNETNGDKYYKFYKDIQKMIKIKGQPDRKNSVKITNMKILPNLIINQTYKTRITIKNTGNFVLNNEKDLIIEFDSAGIVTSKLELTEEKIYPGQEITINWEIKANKNGFLPYSFRIISDGKILTKRDLRLHSYTYADYFFEFIRKSLNR